MSPFGPVEFERALVTGAGGCIGRCLVKRLLAEGCQVNALDVDQASLRRLVLDFPDSKLRVFPGDLADTATLQKACDRVDVVFHAAAKVHTTPRNIQEEAEFFTVNVAGTENLLRCCSGTSLRAFLFFSTIAVYGTGDGSPFSEQTALYPGNAYARSKAEAEQRVVNFFGNVGVRPTVLRMSLVYGEGERGNFSRMMRSVEKGRFLIIGDGRSRKSMIYVEDVVAAALLAAHSTAAQGQVFVLSDPEPYSLRQITETLARHLGVSPPRIAVPAPVLRAAGNTLSLLGRGLGFRPFFTRADVDKLLADTICDVSKIRNTLGFRSQYGLEEGVRRTVLWYREQKSLAGEAR